MTSALMPAAGSSGNIANANLPSGTQHRLGPGQPFGDDWPGFGRAHAFPAPPAAEAKLVSCAAGRAFDVAVDLRRSSRTFLKWVAVEVDESTSFYIPEGCAHGFQALSDEVHLIYQHSSYYHPDAEGGLRFDDPAIAIEWPLPVGTISDRDRSFSLIDIGYEG
jgi:dTDP-4-dehydrorhamnose 3,5-epimerase